MKSKLIACILGLSIILSAETTILAEGEDPSAGSVVQETEIQQPVPDTPPAPETPQVPDTPPENTGGSGGTASETPVSGDGGGSVDPSQTDVPQEGGEGPGSASTESGNSENGTITEDPAVIPVQEEIGDGSESASGAGTEPGTEMSDEDSSGEENVKKPEEEQTDKNKEEDKEKDEEKKEILVVGFAGTGDVTVEKKPALKDAIGLFPTVIEAVLSDGSKIRVPVDWGCVSDYEDKKADRFTFASSLKRNSDGSVYNIGHPIAPGVKFPTANLVIKKAEEEKPKGREPEKKIEEDAPLVMDDVTAANISPDEGEEKVFAYLMHELGLNRAAACGVLANIHYESGFNPHAVGDGGTSYGICQWHAGRYLTLVSFCSSIKLPYGSVEGQLKYLEEELSGGYAHVLDYLKKTPDTAVGAFDAAYYWCYHFERPAMILRQSTLRGNAAKNSYWPRYKDADPEKLEENENSSAVAKKMDLLERKLDSDVEPEETLNEYETIEAVNVQTVAEYRSLAAEKKKFQIKALTEDELSADMEKPSSEEEQPDDAEADDLVFFKAFLNDETDADTAENTKGQELYFTF